MSFRRCSFEMLWQRGKNATGSLICCGKLRSPRVRERIELFLNNINKHFYALVLTRSITKGPLVSSAVGGWYRQGRKIHSGLHIVYCLCFRHSYNNSFFCNAAKTPN